MTIAVLPLLARRTAFVAAILAFASLLSAQELATWQVGTGTVNGVGAHPGMMIADGVLVADSGTQPARVVLLTAPKSVITLGANAAFSLAVEDQGGAKHLIIALDRGAIEVSLGNKGGYADVIVRGAAMNVRVTGTLFVVERVRRDADYVALVSGHVKVGLRREIADALHKPGEEVDLQQHQGLSGTTGSGLGPIEILSGRPSVGDTTHTIHDQSTLGNGSWPDGDNPEVLGQAASAGAGSTNGPNTGIDNSGVNGAPFPAPPPGSLGLGANNPLNNSLQNDINNQIFQGLDHGSLGQQILENTLTPGPLGAPPRPPH